MNRSEVQNPSIKDARAIILAPIGQDARLAAQVLASVGIVSTIVKSVNELCQELDSPTSVILMTEESITKDNSAQLKRKLEEQKPWSDLPIILMTSHKEKFIATDQILHFFTSNANISLLERPFKTLTLTAAVQVALRARKRQFQVRDLMAAQSSALKQRDDFLSIASHELKTPLTSLKLQAQMRRRFIEKGDESVYSRAKVDILISSTEKQVDRLSHLVDEMLDITRIENGKLTLNPEWVDLTTLVREVADSFLTQFQNAGSSFEFNGEEDLKGFWDRYRLEQVIANLFTNAIKYGAGKAVMVRTRHHGEMAELCVQDHGIGIAPDHHALVFQRFERVAESRNIGGLGLGLYITHQIVQTHRGTIRVESELGKGSTFIVELPLNEEGEVYDD